MPKGTVQINRDRFYHRDGFSYVSVTTVLDRLPKPALQIWKMRKLIEDYRENIDAVSGLEPKKVLSYIERLNESSRSSEIGNLAHRYLETRERPEDIDADVQPYLDRLDDFIVEYKPTVLYSERTAISRQWGYAGTADIVMEINGKRYFADLKTGKSVWPEVALQLAAYSRADVLETDDGEIEIPSIGVERDVGIVLHVRPEGYILREVKINDGVFQTFLSVLDVYNWEASESQSVLGKEIPVYE